MMVASTAALPVAWNFVVPAFLGLLAGTSYLLAYGVLAVASFVLLGLALVALGRVTGIVVAGQIGWAILALGFVVLLRAGVASAGRRWRRARGRPRIGDLREDDVAWAGREAVDLAALSRGGLRVRARTLAGQEAVAATSDTSAPDTVADRILETRDVARARPDVAVLRGPERGVARVDRRAGLDPFSFGEDDGARFDAAGWAERAEACVGAPLRLRLAGPGPRPDIVGVSRLEELAWVPVWVAAGGADLAADPICRLERDLVENVYGWGRLLGMDVEPAARPPVRFHEGRPYLAFDTLVGTSPTGRGGREELALWRAIVSSALGRRRLDAPLEGPVVSSMDAIARMRALVRDRLAPMLERGRLIEALAFAIRAASEDEAAAREAIAWAFAPERDERRAMDADLAALAAVDGAADHAASEQRDAFLARWGHRGPGERSLAGERWGASPDALARTLTLVRRTPADDATRGRRDRRRAARPSLVVWPIAWLARRLVARRLEQRDGVMRATAALAGSLVAVGESYVARGILERAEDLLHLTLDEWRALEAAPWAANPELERVARARREEAERAWAELPPSRLLDGPSPVEVVAGDVLDGVATSPGTAEGEVHRMAAPGASLPGGAPRVLVLPDANPHFAHSLVGAAALVCERGGALSHLAIVARERGIPAVMGAVGASERLADGVRVRVDGDTGRVERIDAGRVDASADGVDGLRPT